MAQPAARHRTANANPNPAAVPDANVELSGALRTRVHGSRPRQAEAAGYAKPRHARKGSLKNAKNSTDALRARLKEDAARRAGPQEGRQPGRAWAVGNIGHNGRLYLRPVVRPGNERSKPLGAPFSNAQPRRSLRIGENLRAARPISSLEFDGSQSQSRAGSPPAAPPKIQVQSSAVSDYSVASSQQRGGSVQRSHSFSTIDGHIFTRAEAPGTLRVVIGRARSHRDRTKHNHNASTDTGRLEVPIPGSTLGEPQFGPSGTPTFRSPSQATLGYQHPESIKSGHTSLMQPPQAAYAPPVSRRHSEMSHTAALVFRPSADNSIAVSSPQLAVYMRERDFWAHAYAFDHLETHPVDPSLIIYADFRGPKKRRIIHATPLTLVAQITSSTNVDYDLLSDFFMTFRQFMPKGELLEFLHDRFLWAVARQGNVSTAVRVRTFVALRHWVLNYMAEDFVPDYHLRATFCALMNSLYDYLKEIGATGPKGLEQITELKRCWRQYISLYFDVPYDEYASSSEPIQPGGALDPERDDLDAPGSKLQAQLDTQALTTTKNTHSLRHTRSTINPLGVAQGVQHAQKPSATTALTGTAAGGATNAKSTRPQDLNAINTSQKSSTVWSCSIPFRPHHTLEYGDQTALYKQAAPRTVALPAQLVNPLRANRPKQVHQQDESPTDTASDGQLLVEKLAVMAEAEGQEPTLEQGRSSSISLPGDLIRGRSLLPIAPDIEYQKDKPKFEVAETADKASKGPGVRRVIGSIRRAVSHSRPLQGPPLRHAHLERRGNQLSTISTATRASAPSATSSGTPSMRLTKTERVLGPLRPRTDLLSERSLESFNKALALAPAPVLISPVEVHEPLRDVREVPERLTVPQLTSKRGQSTANVTTGSRSIVIGHEATDAPPSVVDSELLMSGALPTTTTVVQKELSDAGSDLAGFQAPLDDDEPIEVATDDGWQSDDQEVKMQDPTSSPPLSSLQSFDDKSPVASIRGAYLAKEMKARLGHQPTNSLDDPVLPDDPQPSRSLRRRNDRGNLRAAIPSFHERLAAAHGPLPDALHSHPPSQPDSPALQPSDEDLPPMPSPGVLGPSVEEQLKSMLFPDDPEEDGSPATALLKLEGRFDDQSKGRASLDMDLAQDSPTTQDPHDKLRHRHEHVMDAHAPIHEPRSSVVFSQASTAVSPVQAAHRHNQSEVSYNSIPLLQRSLNDRPSPRRRDSDSSESAAAYQFPSRTGLLRAINPDDASDEIELEGASRPESVQGLSLEDIVSRSLAVPGPARFDTLDADGARLGANHTDSEGPRSFYDDRISIKDDPVSGVMLYPGHHPSTPPAAEGEDHDTYSVRISNGLPTPANSPPSRLPPKTNFSAGVYVPTRALDEEDEPQPRPQPPMTAPKHSAFILRFRAERIAEAMTLVEQSALAQVNWRELIDLSWSKTGLEKVRDWAEFVVSPTSPASATAPRRTAASASAPSSPAPGPKSVDVVIARFNVVVKWAVSQILLTDDLFERVHCIQQYIRVAAACRTLRNFASMYQITTALISADLAGLQETWELVPESDKAWLKDMENLVSPLKSFENVRKQQEAVAPGASGCIPFIGVYLNDLALNATRVPTVEKPATLAHAEHDGRALLEPPPPPPSSSQAQKQQGAEQHPPPMINFERYQNAAAIVKTVLRLVDASKQYRFDVNPKLLSKCLWMYALGDEEIRARARALVS